MTQSLADLLGNRNFDEPPEIQEIKQFVRKEIGSSASVSITNESFVVKLPSASAAGALRAKVYQLQKQLGSDKRIVIRIG